MYIDVSIFIINFYNMDKGGGGGLSLSAPLYSTPIHAILAIVHKRYLLQPATSFLVHSAVTDECHINTSHFGTVANRLETILNSSSRELNYYCTTASIDNPG